MRTRKSPTFLHLAALVLSSALGLAATAVAQTTAEIWQDVPESALVATKAAGAAQRTVVPGRSRTLRVDNAALGRALAKAPREFTAAARTTPAEISLPMPDGTFARFAVEDSPLAEAGLEAKFPALKTYVARGLDDPSLTARLDQTPQGFHAIILAPVGSVYIDPYWRNDPSSCVVYWRRDFTAAGKPFSCFVDTGAVAKIFVEGPHNAPRPTGASLRTYRTAVACTGEYATAAGGGTFLGTLGAIITTVNRVSALYERDFAIRLKLVANEDQLIFLNSATDPYTNSNASALLSENQTTCDSVIGSANYDIGHVFSTGGGGLAGLGVVGQAGQKAQGETGSSNPVGDPYDIDYVAHEMGHQFGGNHPFNGTSGSCTGGNRNATTAYEPGSGTTIMAYAGICSPQDLAPNSDDYFHTISYDEIDTYTSSSPGNVGVATATGNTPPTIAALTNFIIPSQTPFALTASATDPDAGDVLTYCWEEFDRGPAQNPTANPRDNGSSPIFRTFAPTTNPTRIFPSLTYILNNANVPPATVSTFATGEFLPTTQRTMTFRVTVRDNRAGGGGSNYRSMTVTSTLAAGPFAVSSFNTASTIAANTVQTINWAVASTNVAPINCANVKISLSTDGGHTFPFVLAASTPNTGTANVTIPNTVDVATTQARFKVEAVGNIFFDISGADTTITSGTNAAPALTVTSPVTVMRGAANAVVTAIATATDTDTPLTATISDAPAHSTITATIVGNTVTVSALAECSVTTTNTSRTYPVTLTVTDSLGATTSRSFNFIVQPNPTPTVGNYSNQSIPAGTSTNITPSAAPADANLNLGATPASVSPTTLPGGGTVTVNQITGVVTLNPSSTTPPATYPIRVTIQDTCGAAVVKTFNAIVTSNPPTITGAVAGQTVTDTTTVFPFTTVNIGDLDVPAQTLTVTVALDLAAKGSFTGTSLAASGFTAGGPGIYTFSGTASAATTAIQALEFAPTPNRVTPGATETTTFTISANDGVVAIVKNTVTTVISTSVNDLPTIAGTVAGQMVNDDATKAPFSGVTIGDVDAPAQLLAVSVTLDFAAQGSFTALAGFTNAGGGVYNFSGTAAGATTAIRGLVFKPTPNRVPLGNTETTGFTISVTDGGTPTVDAATTVIALSVNETPTITGQQLLSTPEETALTVALTDLTVVDSDNIFPTDFTLTVQDGANYARTGNTITPALNFAGMLTVPVTVSDGLTSSASFNLAVNVTPVNDAPSFTKGGDLSVRQNAGAQTFAGWASAISAGGPDESGQALDFIVSTNNDGIFAVLPAISPTGTLTFKPSPATSGTATVTVALHDDGGMAGGGMNTSPTQTFTIETTAVNDPPTFVLGGDQSVAQESGAQTVVGFATNISPGPADESMQTVDFQVSVDHPEFFTAVPAISPDGTLTYTPVATTSGTAVVTVRLHDGGDSDFPNVNLSPAQTFKVAITTFAEELGTYNGLALASVGATPGADKTGLLKLTVGKKGAVSGKLLLGAFSHSFKGTINNAGVVTFGKTNAPTATLKRKAPLSNLTLSDLRVDVGLGSDSLTGFVTDGSAPFATLSADRALYSSKKNVAPPYLPVPPALLGKYTVLFDDPVAPGLPATDVPHGDGYGILTVSKSGVAKLTGQLADGTKIASANSLSKLNIWPLWARIAKGAGALAGPVHFQTLTGPAPTDIDGLGLHWFKPQVPDADHYANGWPTGVTTDLFGSIYVVPPKNPPTSVLPGLGAVDADGNAKMTLSGGEIAPKDIARALNIMPKNNVITGTVGLDKLKLSLTPTTGLLKGSFVHPLTNKTIKFGGVIFQSQKFGSGSFLGPVQAGSVTLIPTDTPGVP